MISIFFSIFILCFILTLFIFRHYYKNERAIRKIEILAYFVFFFVISATIYFNLSNYWVGNGLFNKITNNINIKDIEKIKPKNLIRAVKTLEDKLKNNPNQVNLIKEIAHAKYFLLDLEGALDAFEKGRRLDKEDLDFLIGAANTRLLLEKKNISIETVSLFKEIIIRRDNDITSLIVLADHYFNSENYTLSKKFYKKLLSLIDKNSLEYNEIKNRLEEIEAIK
jgi:formate-dependent nitrite reductase complex subunit NrfG